MEEPRSQHPRQEPARLLPDVVLVFFDGDCALCNRSVRFLLEHDRHGKIRFASLQSTMGLRLQEESSPPLGGSGSILVHDGGEVLRESDAALRLAGLLAFPWNLLGAVVIVPKGFRDMVYRWIARNRLRWFGSTDGCALMRSEWKDRFVDGATRHRDA